jgi:hypothetical protein
MSIRGYLWKGLFSQKIFYGEPPPPLKTLIESADRHRICPLFGKPEKSVYLSAKVFGKKPHALAYADH